MSPENGAQLPLVGKTGTPLVEGRGMRARQGAGHEGTAHSESRERNNPVSILEGRNWKGARVSKGSLGVDRR